MEPFWPRRSPHFARLRAAVRPVLHGLAAEGTPPAVGLSGGPDSLALAAAVAAEARRAPGPDPDSVRPLAVCVDHGLQPGSREVADAAAAQARAWGIDARVIAVDVAQPGEGMEAAARVARYRAFAAVGRPVLVAHTAEDQAETLLLGALRGQATGMAEESWVEGARVLRPLLQLRRADTEGACAELGLRPWHDPQNQQSEFRRVRLRREVLPLLNDILGGDAVAPLALAAADVAADAAALDHPAETDCATLAALPGPVRRRAILAWLRGLGADCSRAGLAQIEALCTNWRGQGGVAVRAGGEGGIGRLGEKGAARLEVRRVGGKLALLPG